MTTPSAEYARTPAASGGLHVVVVDDEPPAREELAYLLRQDARIATVSCAGSGEDALRVLNDADGGRLARPVDALFLDIRMPGLDGLEIARVLGRFAVPPAIVFVTAYDNHAVDAFELQAVDYLLKPVREERLAEAVRRVVSARSEGAGAPADATGHAGAAVLPSRASGPPLADPDETIPVELGGVTRFVARADVRFVEAHGDYARLHTERASHLVRVPLAVLEERWAAAGFVRIHRRHLVALSRVDEVRIDSGRWTVRLGDVVLQVSRRHTRDLRDLLLARAGAPPAHQPDRSGQDRA